MKKLTALLVSLAMVFTMLPMAAIAEGDEDAAVPEDAEEISAGSFGFDGPEIFDESLTNPGVELGGDEEQDETEDEALEDETTPETDEDAPSEEETEEPAEEPTEEPTEVVSDENDGEENESGVTAEALKEFVDSLREEEFTVDNVALLFLIFGIIDSENPAMTDEEYFDAVVDNGIDNMNELIDSTIAKLIDDLRATDPNWGVQSDPSGFEGPGFEGQMPTDEEIAQFYSAVMPMASINTMVQISGPSEAQATVTGLTSGGSPAGRFFSGEYSSGMGVTVTLSGNSYEITAATISNASMGVELELEYQSTSVTISDDIMSALTSSGVAIIKITAGTPSAGDLNINVGTPPKDAPQFEISGERDSKLSWHGTGVAKAIMLLYGQYAKVGDTVTIEVTNPNDAGVDKLEVSGDSITDSDEEPYSVTFTLSKSEAVTVTVKYKTHASVTNVTYKVKRGSNGDFQTEPGKGFSDYLQAIIINGVKYDNETGFKNAIKDLYVGDTITLELQVLLGSGYAVDKDNLSVTGATSEGSKTDSGFSGLTLGENMSFTFAFTGELPDPTITVAPLTLQSNGGFIVFTIENYASYGGAAAFSGATVSASCDATTNPTTKEAQPSIDKQGVTISSDGKFGIQFNPKKGSNINYDYTYDVTGDVIYEGNHFNKEAAITIKGAKAAS